MSAGKRLPLLAPTRRSGSSMHVLLLATFELGRQPFGLASPAAFLRERGATVRVRDLSLDALDEEEVRASELVALHVPMHTATRLAVEVLHRVRQLNPGAKTCFFGLYAPVQESWLRSLGVDVVLGGEFEEGLVDAWQHGGRQPRSVVSRAKQAFPVPDRTGLPPLDRYAKLVTVDGREKKVAYVEASRGCKHLCRHCPVVPVYDGVFRIVGREVVLADIAQQVAAGAEHVTFGDPDFFNGMGHALGVVRALHERFPALTYDVTIKVEHLRRRRDSLAELVATGCAFVTTAAESIDDAVLSRLDKGHTRSDLIEVLEHASAIGLPLAPTFVPFTPWTTLAGYARLLQFVDEHDLVGAVPGVQLAIRLLLPAGSRLLELPDIGPYLGQYDEARLTWTWANPDPRVDRLQAELEALVAAEGPGAARGELFQRIRQRAHEALGRPIGAGSPRRDPITIPFMTEPWY